MKFTHAHTQIGAVANVCQACEVSKYMASSGASACTSCDCRRFGTGAGGLPREPASLAESARPAKTGSGASASLQEPAWRVAPASTRRRRGQACVSHARRLRSVRRNRIAAAAVATRKAPAQIAEAAGTLCEKVSPGRCATCALGSFKTSSGSEPCSPCVAGCDAGTYQSNCTASSGTLECTNCTAAPGFYCPAGSTYGSAPSGTACPLGHYCTGGTQDKQMCAVSAGWYCPPGTKSADGTKCPGGHYCTGKANDKTACAGGTRPSQRAPTVKRAQVRLLGSSVCSLCEPSFRIGFGNMPEV